MAIKSMWIVSMKAFLVTCGIVSSAVAIKFSTSFVFNELPAVWSTILPWTRPPYLYLIINGIIITIAASSRFHQATSSPSIPSERFVSVKSAPPSDFASIPEQSSLLVYESEDTILEVKAVVVNGAKQEIDRYEEKIEAEAEFDGEDKFVISSSMYGAPHKIISPDLQSEFLLPVTEKSFVPSTNSRKSIRTNSKGPRVPRVKRPKNQQTLESTWKMITQGRDPSTEKHLKVNGTWEHNQPHLTRSRPEYLPKCKTFNNRQQPLSSLASTKNISREPSPCEDEFNFKVQKFIEKSKEEMRLQRQESLNQYRKKRVSTTSKA